MGEEVLDVVVPAEASKVFGGEFSELILEFFVGEDFLDLVGEILRFFRVGVEAAVGAYFSEDGNIAGESGDL